ncbi:MAG: hypothetical protein PUE05_08115 [bacterium]|nr:hypothetical protein [bacterium]
MEKKLVRIAEKIFAKRMWLRPECLWQGGSDFAPFTSQEKYLLLCFQIFEASSMKKSIIPILLWLWVFANEKRVE